MSFVLIQSSQYDGTTININEILRIDWGFSSDSSNRIQVLIYMINREEPRALLLPDDRQGILNLIKAIGENNVPDYVLKAV
jgi:hypothetical protein